jgi:hypothetical protein
VPSYQFGDIVMLVILDPNGVNPKLRPALIISTDDEMASNAVIRVASVSSSNIPDPLSPMYFELPWKRGKHPKTGLDRRSVVKCDWLAEVTGEQVISKIGTAPASVLIQVSKYFASQSGNQAGTLDEKP